jgi:hypothetical protein
MRHVLRGSLSRMRLRRWSSRLSGASPGLRRGTSVLLTLSVIVSVVAMAIWPAPTSASYVNVLYNGGFEQGFGSQPGCGMVGSGWTCFTNGGAANYGYYDDQWDRTVAEGLHSQLIEINTKGIDPGDPDRYAGIYQTVPVVDWAQYTLSLNGMIRTTVMGGDPWRYRVQVGWSNGPTPNWGAVSNWTDVGWDKYYERTDPKSFLSYTTSLMAEADYVTIYLRVWKKWGVPNEEIDINFDNVALYGPSPYHPYPVKPVHPIYPEHPVVDPVYPVHPVYPDKPVVGPVHPIAPIHPGCVDPCQPVIPPVGVCAGPELVYNGSFEMGFNPVAVGHVGNSWGFFTNGGGANYGFYDDQWPRVVADGKHSQLIEINTKNLYPVDNDRYAGIYQYISGLQPGVTYEFRMKGLLRGEGSEDDPYRFAAQVGYVPGYSAEWGKVGNWTEMNLGPISKRTDPAPLAEYTMKFTAPAHDMTLFIRGWKKWGIPNVEMDFNIDAVSVRACLLYGTGGPVHPVHPEKPIYKVPHGDIDPGYGYDHGYGHDDKGYGHDGGYGGGVCAYAVQPGDSLSWVAQSMGVNQYALTAANGIVNPDLIYVGQVLTNPNCGAMGGAAYAEAPAMASGYGAAEAYGTGYDMPAVEMPAGEAYGEYAAAGYGVEAYVGDGYAAAGYAEGATEYNGMLPATSGGPAYPEASGAWDQPALAMPTGGENYTVQVGDNLSQVAAAYGVSVSQLMQANGLQNPNIIYVGQLLIIP